MEAIEALGIIQLNNGNGPIRTRFRGGQWRQCLPRAGKMKSNVDSSWDVMKYKYHYELEHQWDLKRRFIDAHKTKYPEDRLVCLAQLFCNVHFMGCSYEDNIMALIKELSEGIAGKNSKWEKQSFVAASNAVEERVKGRLNAPQRGPPPGKPGGRAQFQQSSSASESNQSSDASQSKFIKFIQSNVHGADDDNQAKLWGDSSDKNYAVENEQGQQSEAASRKRSASPVEEDEFYRNKKFKTSFANHEIQEEIRFVKESGPFGNVVLFQSANFKESNVAIMERTASAAQMRVSYNFMPIKRDQKGQTDTVLCKLSLDGMYLSQGTGPSNKTAKDLACQLAIEHLKETSFTILVKAAFTSDGAEVERNLVAPTASSNVPSVNVPISDDNIGNKMLKMMGWGGGGLGKDQQGIEEPINAEGTVKREGLGRNRADFNPKVHALLRDYVMGDSKQDLVFSTDFSKEERKVIHEASRKYGLKSKSFGNDENRQLVIFKKSRPLDIVEDLLAAGCETPKYKLLPPKSMIERFTL